MAQQSDAEPPPDIGTPTPGIAGPTAVVVTNSPWQVLVGPRAVADLQSPSGVAVDNDGNVYVADFQGNFVQKFSPDGQPAIRFGTRGAGGGPILGAVGRRRGRPGNIYVADTNNQRIQKLSPTGQPLGMGQGWRWRRAVLAAPGRRGGCHGQHLCGRPRQPPRPGAFAGRRAVGAVGFARAAPGQFWSPSDVAVDKAGNIYVADTTNQRVQVLSLLASRWRSGAGRGRTRAVGAADSRGGRRQRQRLRERFAQRQDAEVVAERPAAGGMGHRRWRRHAAASTRARHLRGPGGLAVDRAPSTSPTRATCASRSSPPSRHGRKAFDS